MVSYFHIKDVTQISFFRLHLSELQFIFSMAEIQYSKTLAIIDYMRFWVK